MLRRDRYYESRGWKRLLGVVVTFHFVAIGWVFFRSDSFETAFVMLRCIATDFRPELLPQVIGGYSYVFMLIALGYLTHFIPQRADELFVGLLRRGRVVGCALFIVAVIYLVIQVKNSVIQPFIYFQF